MPSQHSPKTLWTGPNRRANWSVFPYSSVLFVLRRTQYRTPVGSLENVVLCCALSKLSKLLCDWQSVNQYVLVSSTLVGLATRYYFLSEYCCLNFAILHLPYHSNDRAVLLRVYVAMGMFCIATNTCRLVLLRIGYRCSQRVEGFHGRFPRLIYFCLTNGYI
jgi:hypothetical protein